MAKLILYIEPAVKELTSLVELNIQLGKLKNFLLTSKDPRVISETHLKMSEIYSKKALWIYSILRENNDAYHCSVAGHMHLQLAKDIPQNLLPRFYKETLRYAFLFCHLKRPTDQTYFYDIPHPGEIEFSAVYPPKTVEDFIDAIEMLQRNHLVDADMAAYQAFLTLTGYKDELSRMERCALLANTCQRLHREHPCYQEVNAAYRRLLNQYNFFPFIFNENYRFDSQWGADALTQLCDDWLMARMQNEHLFVASRQYISARNVTYNQSYSVNIAFESFLEGRTLTRTLTLAESDFMEFIGHLHPFNIGEGSCPNSPAYFMDLALQQCGYLDANFCFTGLSKLAELKTPGAQFTLLQTIKDLTRRYGASLREDDLKKFISNLYENIAPRLKAVEFFRSFNFETFHFVSALFLLYQGLSHESYRLPMIDDTFQLRDAFARSRKLLTESLPVNLDINALFESQIPYQDKFKKLKTLCEHLIEEAKKNRKFIIQIQATDSQLSHAIYGVLELIPPDENHPNTGMQLVISNGGDGAQYHQLSKGEKSHPVPIVEENRSFSWPNTDWIMRIGRHTISEGNILYKAIRVDNIDDPSAYKAFCYYLILCCSGQYLKGICTMSQFIEALYRPHSHIIKHAQWPAAPNLDSLKVIDIEGKVLPKQIIGNCTVHNAIYAISYAESLHPTELWYLNFMLEIGTDLYRTSVDPKRRLTTLSQGAHTSLFVTIPATSSTNSDRNPLAPNPTP